MVKTAILYFLVLFTAYPALSQVKKGREWRIPMSFPDSIRIVFEKSNQIDAQFIGSAFFKLWDTLAPDHQALIRKQTRILVKKKLPLRPHQVNYFGAIVNAVNIEKASRDKITDYLMIAGKVLEKYDGKKIQNFLLSSRVFFQHHALNYEKPFRLYARDDDYAFEFIEPPPPLDMSDSAMMARDSIAQISALTTPQPDPDTVATVDTLQSFMPIWMTPTPTPIAEGPVIRFNQVSLNFVTAYDSVFLKKTKGAYLMVERLFVGEGGSFDWSPALLSPDSVNCDFTTYFFPVNKPQFTADLVKFNYAGKTPGRIPGKFEFKSVARKDSVPSTFPTFYSYQSDLNIQNIGRGNIRYRGGFALVGNSIRSASVNSDVSTIDVYIGEEKKFTARSTVFEFLDSAIQAQKARITLYQMNDSIAHPQVRMRYFFPSDSVHRLSLQKDKGQMRLTPYTTSFFSMDFSADILRWDLLSDSLDIMTDGGRDSNPVVVESYDYYDAEDFRVLNSTVFPFHPLALVASYSIKTNLRQFYSGDLANYSKRPSTEIKNAMLFLSQKGMIEYNPRTDVINVKPKAINFFRAYKGQMDYDNMKIHSVIDTLPNVTINFAKQVMVIRGVEEFNVSDSLNVRIKPDSSIITVLQNRDLKFNGTIYAGNFEISGKDFMLKYDSFYVNLNHIDSINFFVEEKNAKGQTFRRKVNNSMVGADSTAAAAGGLESTSNTAATLYISKASNKSGKTKIPNFPRLDASAGGVIYFDREDVLNGAYDRSMFFVIPPFKLDSLNDADPASINFDGTFVSSGMLPNFKEKLHTMPDKSLGFEHVIPPGGYALYKGDGLLNGGLYMDNRGLRANGQIDFLGASVLSPDFVFYPDSVVARGNRAFIKKGQYGPELFPQASFQDYSMKWYPKRDEMYLKNVNNPFNFYDSTAQFRGTVMVSKNGVFGTGKLDTRGTELISRKMKFNGNEFSATRAKFTVKSEDPTKPLLLGNDVRLKFNLEQNYADISPEVEGVAAINFPYAQMKTSIPNAHWDVTAEKITMTKSADVPLENSYFYTTRKELDSLWFNASKAEYNLKTQELLIGGIPYITVADARITPENGEVLVLENSRIGTLKNTTIVLDTLNAYHRLTEGVVDIISRNKFSGYATYQYVNLLQDTFAIKMTDFHLEPIGELETTKRSKRKQSVATHQTVGVGAVAEKDTLVLGASMFYKGDITMYATRPALQLKGYVKLDIKNIPKYNTWIQYAQTGEETEVLIDFEKAINEEGKKVDAGLHFSSKNNDIYISFLSDKHDDGDDDFFVPSGILHYDHEVHQFKIEDLQKATGNKLSGKVFSYNDNNHQVRFEGPVNLVQASKGFGLEASVLGTGNIETNEISMNALVMLNTNVPPAVFDLMAKKIQEVIKNEGVDEGLGDATELLYKMADIVGERVAKDYEQKSLQGYVSLGTLAPLVKPITFSNVSFKWSPQYKAFYNEGKLGISNILKNDINGAFEGFMEVKRTEDGSPIFNVFFKASPEAWYYFGLEGSRMLVHSADPSVNNYVAKKTNAGKAKVGEISFVPGSDEETLSFINRFRKEYYGIETPYNLYEGTEAAQKEEEKEKKTDDGF